MKKDNVTEEQLDEMIKDLEDNVEDRIYQKLDEIKNDLKSIKSKFVKELTVSELKQLIREVVSDEIVKHSFTSPQPFPMPVQPWYESPNPYKPAYEVWCDTKTTPKKENITNTAEYETKLNGLPQYGAKLGE